MLERGQIDVVIGPRNLCDGVPELSYDHLIDDRVGILCRTGHVLAHKRTLAPDDFRDQMWLFHSRGSLLRQQTEAAMNASGIDQIRIACETDSIRSALEITASTDLVTTMPKATTKPYLGEGLMFLPFDHPKFERPLGAGAAARRTGKQDRGRVFEAIEGGSLTSDCTLTKQSMEGSSNVTSPGCNGWRRGGGHTILGFWMCL